MAGTKMSEEEATIRRSIKFHEAMMKFNESRLKDLTEAKSTQLPLFGPPK